MNLLSVLIGILIGSVGLFLLVVIPIYIKVRKVVKENVDGKHHCNECRKSYIYDKEEIEFKYCPLCGKELTYYYEERENGLYEPSKI